MEVQLLYNKLSGYKRANSPSSFINKQHYILDRNVDIRANERGLLWPILDQKNDPNIYGMYFTGNIWWRQLGLLEALLRSCEYGARHVNDECSEAAAPLPGAREAKEYASVLPPTWTAKGEKTTTTTARLLLYFYRFIIFGLLTKKGQTLN